MSGQTLQPPISAPTSGSVYIKEHMWQDQSWGGSGGPGHVQDREMCFAKLLVLHLGHFFDPMFYRCSAPAWSFPGWHSKSGWRVMMGGQALAVPP